MDRKIGAARVSSCTPHLFPIPYPCFALSPWLRAARNPWGGNTEFLLTLLRNPKLVRGYSTPQIHQNLTSLLLVSPWWQQLKLCASQSSIKKYRATWTDIILNMSLSASMHNSGTSFSFWLKLALTLAKSPQWNILTQIVSRTSGK